ncbi:MAG: 2-hydroxyacid dehydrogenase [Dehalococcoidia bacterium]
MTDVRATGGATATQIRAGKPRVFLATPVPDPVGSWIEAACDVVRWEGRGRATRDDVAKVLPSVVGLLTSNQLKIDHELILANPRLRVVSNFGVGYDNIDIAFATAHGLLVCNTPDVLTDAVADMTYLMILGLAKHIIDAHAHMLASGWAHGRPFRMGIDLKDKTLGLLGFGRIGHAVARRAAPFGLRVCYYDPIRDAEAEQQGLASFAERDEVIRSADFLSLHTFLDETTRKHFGKRELALMKPSAYLINTSRGPVLDQDALVEALQNNRIAGAGLDVFEVEPLAADHPLTKLTNVLLGPHMATATVETRQAMAERCGRNLIAAVTGGVPEAMVNPEALAARR